jgi:hypothetical protein
VSADRNEARNPQRFIHATVTANSKKDQTMNRIKQNPHGHGSLKDIQILINKNQDIIDREIKKSLKGLSGREIIWTSPIESDDFAEYRDNGFIENVELDPKEIKLNEFWPTRGPQWDALARTKNGDIILVEAKANIPEIVSPATGASESSKELIDRSLLETKEYLNIKNDIDWSGKFYQYTNRIAHLYFLREKCNKSAYLINVYFIGDKSVNGPESILEWQGALTVLHTYLGLTHHKLSKYMADIFIDINDLNKEENNDFE